MHNSAICNNITKMTTSCEKSRAENKRGKSETATNCAFLIQTADFFVSRPCVHTSFSLRCK